MNNDKDGLCDPTYCVRTRASNLTLLFRSTSLTPIPSVMWLRSASGGDLPPPATPPVCSEIKFKVHAPLSLNSFVSACTQFWGLTFRYSFRWLFLRERRGAGWSASLMREHLLFHKRNMACLQEGGVRWRKCEGGGSVMGEKRMWGREMWDER